MTFSDRQEASKLRNSVKIVKETEKISCVLSEVVFCENHVVCADLNCPLYHSGMGFSSRSQLRELIFQNYLDAEFVPSPPKSPPKYSPSPRRKFVSVN